MYAFLYAICILFILLGSIAISKAHLGACQSSRSVTDFDYQGSPHLPVTDNFLLKFVEGCRGS